MKVCSRIAKPTVTINVVFSIGFLSFDGDLPASIFHMRLVETNGTLSQRSYRSSARTPGHLTLHGKAYKFDRAIVTERHYKDLVTELQKRRAQVELCGATSRVVVGATKDLIPRIKVNRNAMARTTQLVQEGLVKRVRQSTAAWAARELPELAEIAKMLGYKLGLTCSVTSEEAHSTPLWGL